MEKNFPPAVRNAIQTADDFLVKFPFLEDLAAQTKCRKVYLAATGAFVFLLVFFNICAGFIVNSIGIVVPAVLHLDDLRHPNIKIADAQSYITYWIIFATAIVAERALNIPYWFPFYFTIKLFFLAILALPNINGAKMFYPYISNIRNPLAPKAAPPAPHTE